MQSDNLPTAGTCEQRLVAEMEVWTSVRWPGGQEQQVGRRVHIREQRSRWVRPIHSPFNVKYGLDLTATFLMCPRGNKPARNCQAKVMRQGPDG